MEDMGERMLYNCHLAKQKATLSYWTQGRKIWMMVVMVNKLKI